MLDAFEKKYLTGKRSLWHFILMCYSIHLIWPIAGYLSFTSIYKGTSKFVLTFNNLGRTTTTISSLMSGVWTWLEQSITWVVSLPIVGFEKIFKTPFHLSDIYYNPLVELKQLRGNNYENVGNSRQLNYEIHYISKETIQTRSNILSQRQQHPCLAWWLKTNSIVAIITNI